MEIKIRAEFIFRWFTIKSFLKCTEFMSLSRIKKKIILGRVIQEALNVKIHKISVVLKH